MPAALRASTARRRAPPSAGWSASKRTAAPRLGGEGIRRFPPQPPNGELAVGEGGLHAGAVALGQLDLPLVAAVLPLVDQMLAGWGAAQMGPEAQRVLLELDGHVVGGDS